MIVKSMSRNYVEMKKLAKRAGTKAAAKARAAANRKRLKEWATFLEDDADFDYAYILKVLKYKLARTREHISSHRMIRDWRKVAKEIREVEKLLNRVLHYDYFWERMKPIHSVYGKPKRKITKIFKHDKPKEIKGYQLDVKYANETEENKERLQEELKAATDGAENDKLEDLKKAFQLMADNIWGWWD